MATAGMLERVHIIKGDELEQAVDAYETSKKWWIENVNRIRQLNFKIVTDKSEISDIVSKYKWD